MKHIYTLLFIIAGLYEANAQNDIPVRIEGRLGYYERPWFTAAGYLEGNMNATVDLGKNQVFVALVEVYGWKSSDRYMQNEDVANPAYFPPQYSSCVQYNGGIGAKITKETNVGVMLGYHSVTNQWNNLVVTTITQTPFWDIYARVQVTARTNTNYTSYEGRIISYPFSSLRQLGLGITFDKNTGQGVRLQGRWGGFRPYMEVHYSFLHQTSEIAASFGLICVWGFSSKGTILAPFYQEKPPVKEP